MLGRQIIGIPCIQHKAHLLKSNEQGGGRGWPRSDDVPQINTSFHDRAENNCVSLPFSSTIALSDSNEKIATVAVLHVR